MDLDVASPTAMHLKLFHLECLPMPEVTLAIKVQSGRF